MKQYKVTYSIDNLDTNPIIKIFDFHNDMEDWISEEVNNRIQFTVDHSPYSISEDDRNSIEEIEYSLIKIEEVNK